MTYFKIIPKTNPKFYKNTLLKKLRRNKHSHILLDGN